MADVDFHQSSRLFFSANRGCGHHRRRPFRHVGCVLLARGGLQITLTDLHQVYPPDFRAEQLVGTQVEMLQRLDVLDFLVHDAVRAERAVITRGADLLVA